MASGSRAALSLVASLGVPVELLGVELSEELAAFYREVEAAWAERGVTLYADRDDGPAFGGFYIEGERARLGIRRDLPPDAFLHTLAHELAHSLQRKENWPRATANPALGEGSPAEEVASVLQAIVHCAAANLRIAPLGLDPSWEHRERHNNIRMLLRAPHIGADQHGTPAWAYWALLYAYLGIIHAPEQTRTLLRNIRRALPDAADTGDEVIALINRHGYATREQALAALRAVQEAMDLSDSVRIEDPADGAVYV